MIVIFVDRGAFPLLARSPAIAPKFFTAAFTAATAATPAPFAPAGLKIPASIATAPTRTSLASAAALTTIILALTAARTLASAPTAIWLTRTRSGGHRRDGSRSRFGRGDFFAQFREEFSEHIGRIKMPNLS
jgi:hypothetical protein